MKANYFAFHPTAENCAVPSYAQKRDDIFEEN